MSMTTTFNFLNPSDYTLNNIDISDDVASLSLVSNPGQTFSQSLSSSSGFTFDASKTAIGTGSLTQISQVTTPILTGEVNVSVVGDVITKTSVGNAWDAGAVSIETITGDGFVQFVADSTATYRMAGLSLTDPGGGYQAYKYAIYLAIAGVLNVYENGAIVGSFGTYSVGDVMRISITGTTVNYLKNGTSFYTSLIPASFPLFFACSIYEQGASITAMQMQDSATQYESDSITFPAFSYSGLGSINGFSGFTTGGDVNSPGYILNGLYWNGSTWLSSNGTYAQSNPKGVVSTNIATLPNNNTITVRVITQASDSQQSISGPLVLTYSGQIYPVSGGTILTNSGLNAETLLSFASVYSQSGNDTITFALMVNGVLTYWNGSAWVASNGSYSQTNTASTILAHAGTLLSVNSIVKVYTLLVSGNGSTTPSIISISVAYKFGQIPPDAPATTIVYGFIVDIEGTPVSGISLTFSLVNLVPNAYMAASDHVLFASSVTTTTDENGYFEQAVLATTQFEGTNTFIQVTLRKGSIVQSVGSNGKPLYLTIPIQANIDITSILSG